MIIVFAWPKYPILTRSTGSIYMANGNTFSTFKLGPALKVHHSLDKCVNKFQYIICDFLILFINSVRNYLLQKNKKENEKIPLF